MATIPLIPNKRKLLNLHDSKKENKIHAAVYNTDIWRKLRLNYLINNPVCELCNNALATDVHHKIEISKGTNEAEMKQIGFNEDNLMSLCKECHKSKHKTRKNDRHR